MASHGMSDGRKESTTTARPPPEQGLRCPRCDSPNTKFCYYNNYSLSQPRHFCKACRRYWTKGGALRKVPVGGGCRKKKKAAASATRAAAGADDSDGGSAGPRFLHGGPVELQLSRLPFSQLNSPSNVYNQFFTFGDLSSSMIGPSSSSYGSSLQSATTGPIGNSPSTLLSFGPCPMTSPILRQGEGIGDRGIVYERRSIQDQMGSHFVNMQINSIASSIESLSSMNQDLHLKLQQQRFAMLVEGSHRDQNSAVLSVSPSMVDNQQNHQLPISFQASESSKINGDHNIHGNRTLMVTASDHLLESSSQEMQTWSDMHQFSGNNFFFSGQKMS